MTPVSRTSSLALLVVLGAAFGCVSTGVGNPGLEDSGSDDAGLSSTEQALVDDGNESLDTGDVSSAIAYVPLISLLIKDDVVDGPTAATRALRSAQDPKFGRDAIFADPTCITATAVGNVAKFDFNKCDVKGFSFKNVTGTINATYNVISANEIEISLDSSFSSLGVFNKKSGGYTALTGVTQSGSATLKIELGVRTQSWNGRYMGQTPTGRKITHDEIYTWTKDFVSQCLEIPIGATTSAIEGPPRGLTVSITDYKRCGTADKCPASGTLVFTDKASGLSVSIHFLGGQAARVTGPLGRPFDTTLNCKL